jgi:hypothetical protein
MVTAYLVITKAERAPRKPALSEVEGPVAPFSRRGVITVTAPIALKGNHKEGLVPGVARDRSWRRCAIGRCMVDLRPAQFNRQEVFDEQGLDEPV